MKFSTTEVGMRLHAFTLLSRAAYEYTSQLACDVVLVARDGVELRAHKVVLAAYSDYFARRAEASEWNDCSAPLWIQLGGVHNLLHLISTYCQHCIQCMHFCQSAQFVCDGYSFILYVIFIYVFPSNT